MRTNVPPALATSIFTLLRERLEGRLGQHNRLCLTVNCPSNGEFVASPEISCTIIIYGNKRCQPWVSSSRVVQSVQDY